LTVKLVYFAWVRERIGMAEEHVSLPENVKTGADLISWLAGRGDGYAHALEEPLAIRVAADQTLIDADDMIGEAHEIALFPPMTGG